MKEVTCEEWQKNPTPRMMWCWNSNVEYKVQMKVVSVIKCDACTYPVMSVIDDNLKYETYQHCAEIEEQRRMTNKELSRWLREKPTREFKYSSSISCSVHSTYTYTEDDGEEEVSKDILIREDDGEWREPLVEVGE